MSNPASILLIKLRHHGDVLLTTPVARTLKENFPTCRIDLLVYEGTEPLVKNNPDLHRVWSWDRSTHGWRKLWKYVQLFRQLQKQHYDLVIHLSDQMQGAFLAKLLAPQSAIGIDYPKRRNFLWRSCFTKLAPLFASNTRHTVEQNLAALEPLGLDAKGDQARCRLVVERQDRSVMQVKLQQAGISTPYIVVHPAARWFFKCWEDDRFAEVIEYFADQGWLIVLTSASEKEEMSLVDSVIQKTTSPRIVSLAGQLTFGQLAALIEGARLFVGVDSVPMHMAAALQKDTVALFGPSKVNEWHPWMTRYHLIHAGDYGSLIDPDAVETSTQQRYLSNIPVRPVIEAMELLLEK